MLETILNIFIIFCGIITVMTVYALLWGAPYLPSPVIIGKEISKIIPKNSKFIELGSGDGRICQIVAQNSGANCTGIEFSPILYFISVCRKWWNWKLQLKFCYGNFMSYNLNNFDSIYVYLLPWKIDKIIDHVLTFEKHPTTIISYSFKSEKHPATKTIKLPKYHTIYIYEFSRK